MNERKLSFNTPDDVEAVYYESFMHCDIDVMNAIWANGDVICVHPGSDVIVGHKAVLRSWAHIFYQSQPPQFSYEVIKREISDDLAVHLVSENIGLQSDYAVVLATNVYKLHDHGWLMIEHHASLVNQQHQAQSLQ